MYNYQSEVYLNLVKQWRDMNLTTEEIYARLGKVSQHFNEQFDSASHVITENIPSFVKDSPLVNNMYTDWLKYYEEAYDWIHPKLLAFSNPTMHYGTGVLVGVLASVLILMLVLAKFVPSRLKSLIYIFLFLGTSASLFVLQSFKKLVTESSTDYFLEYWQYFLGYIVISGLVSFAIVYRYGPVEDKRSLSLIQWLLQGVGLGLVFYSTQVTEVSVALVLLLLVIYNFPVAVFRSQRMKNIRFKLFRPKVKLLTEEEYHLQANESTKMELEKLREYCRSPDCKAWKVISKLKNPHRFAEFVTQGMFHLSTEELAAHDAAYDPPVSEPESFSDTVSEASSELVFVLGNPNMTVRV